MIGMRVGNRRLLDELAARLGAVATAAADPMPLAEEVKAILIAENERQLLAGVDLDGSETARLRPATIRRGRPGDGPARVPRSSSSRLIAGFDVAISPGGAHGFEVVGSWPLVPFARHLDDGTKWMLPRPFIGVSPTTLALLEDAAHRHGGVILSAGSR